MHAPGECEGSSSPGALYDPRGVETKARQRGFIGPVHVFWELGDEGGLQLRILVANHSAL